MAAAKSGWLQSRKVGRNDDGPIAATLATRDFDNRTLAYDADLEAKVGALTPEQIKAALARHLDPAKWVIVKAGDFKAASRSSEVVHQARNEGRPAVGGESPHSRSVKIFAFLSTGWEACGLEVDGREGIV